MSAKYVVIGGAGSMGRITVRDLYETALPGEQLVIADYDQAKAEEYARELSALPQGKSPRPQLTVVRLDVTDIGATAGILRGASVAVNCAHYHYNLPAMEASLQAGAHYVDLGGLFHVTRKQLEWHDRFKSAGVSAVVGMGAAPGITNLLASLGAEGLDEVTEIHARVGSMDNSRYEPKVALPVSYSLKTILEEFSFEPAVFTKGKFTFVKPMSGDVPHRFPAPIGIRRPMYTIHSEVATLPLSFAGRGVREVSFKIAFDPEFTDRVRFLRDLGMANEKPIQIGGVSVAPIDVVNRVAMTQAVPKRVGPMRQYEVVRTVVKGRKGRKKVTVVADCHTAGMPAWGIGLDIDTGSPPAVVAQMLARGEITERGAVAPEIAVPAERFFQHLKRRKMTVKLSRKAGWGFAV